MTTLTGEYLAKASQECVPNNPSKWRHTQQQLLKCGHYKTVIRNMESYAMMNDASETSKCYDHLKKRTHQLHYHEAIKNNLVIGSGEIESAHKYIIQNRMKITGAWWTIDNVKSIICLNIQRNNNKWHNYWEQLYAA